MEEAFLDTDRVNYKQTKRDVFRGAPWEGSWRLNVRSAHKHPSFRKDSRTVPLASLPSPTQTAEEKVLSSKAVCASVMLKSARLTLAHPTEGEAPLLNTICLQCGAAKSRIIGGDGALRP